MPKSILTILSLIVLTLFPWASPASEISDGDLYRSQTIVTGTGETERIRGFRVALTDVLIKLVGHHLPDSITKGRLKKVNPTDFVVSFSYEDRMKGIPLHDEQGTRDRPHFLRIRFEKTKLDELLATLKLVKWPAPRPTITVLLGIHTKAEEYVLTSEGSAGYGQRAVLTDHAVLRGVPLYLPSARKIDKASVGFDDVSALNLERLNSFISNGSLLLIGALTLRDNGRWDIDWLFAHGSKQLSWSKQAVSFDAALKDGIERSAQILSEAYNARAR